MELTSIEPALFDSATTGCVIVIHGAPQDSVRHLLGLQVVHAEGADLLHYSPGCLAVGATKEGNITRNLRAALTPISNPQLKTRNENGQVWPE
jgi:hypothetical protein